MKRKKKVIKTFKYNITGRRAGVFNRLAKYSDMFKEECYIERIGDEVFSYLTVKC